MDRICQGLENNLHTVNRIKKITWKVRIWYVCDLDGGGEDDNKTEEAEKIRIYAEGRIYIFV